MDQVTDTDLCARIEQDGYAVVPAGLTEIELHHLTLVLEQLGREIDLGVRGGIRDAFRVLPPVRDLAVSPPMWRLASAILGRDCVAVRAIIFDKTPAANWKVSWHQDLTIAVAAYTETPGFGPWSEKAGILHVQPPVAVLERMLTLRLHLDPCGSDNGAVRVLPGSHRAGRLSGAEIDGWRTRQVAHDCLAARGDVLAMRPLLLHASSPATSPRHRRVIHVEYATAALPASLQWHEAWRPGNITISAG